MGGFSLAEVGAEAQAQHWLRGGFPLAFLASSIEASAAWRKSFVQAFLERDLPQFGIAVPAQTLLRFWTMLAHYHGQVWNAAELGPFTGRVAAHRAPLSRYADRVFMVRQLQPWHANLGKRQIKAPKVYLRDSGMLHHLLGIRSQHDLLLHPKLGASWEGYAVEEALKAVAPDEAYFWGTHTGAELDLFSIKDGRRVGVECKRVDAPRLTPSMHIALDDLALDHSGRHIPARAPIPWPSASRRCRGPARSGQTGRHLPRGSPTYLEQLLKWIAPPTTRSPCSAALWQRIPAWAQAKLLANVWCSHCAARSDH